MVFWTHRDINLAIFISVVIFVERPAKIKRLDDFAHKINIKRNRDNWGPPSKMQMLEAKPFFTGKNITENYIKKFLIFISWGVFCSFVGQVKRKFEYLKRKVDVLTLNWLFSIFSFYHSFFASSLFFRFSFSFFIFRFLVFFVF